MSVKKDAGPEPIQEVCAAVGIQETEEKQAVYGNTCVICGQPVSEKVRQYCLDHEERFGGQIYCFQHQKGIKGFGGKVDI